MKQQKQPFRLFSGPQTPSPAKASKLLAETGLVQQDWYLQRYPDALKSGLSAIEHYVKHGEALGYWPNPYFDPEWYRGHAPGARKSGTNALLHYYLYGWKKGKDPSREFSTELYLAEYAAIRKLDVNPLSYHLLHGKYENKITFPRALTKAEKQDLIADMRIIAGSGLFVEKWYNQYYIDRWQNGVTVNALYHYVTAGFKQNRKPNPIFEPQFYKKMYGKRIGNQNPLVHYITEGEKKGYLAATNFCPNTYYKRHKELNGQDTLALAHYIENGLPQGEPRPKPEPTAYKTNKATASARLPIDSGLRGQIDFDKKDLAPHTDTFDPESLKIHWVIPDFAAGGGGHMTIFRMVEFLERSGHRQTIWLHNPTIHHSAEDAYDTILKHFKHFGGKVRILDKRFEKAKGDIIIATDCWTVWPVLSAEKFKRRFYFVQDYEPAFHPVGAYSLAAEQTYKEDIDCICASPWLEKLMKDKYGRWARSFWLAADTEQYFPVSKKQENKKPRIAFYARHHTARRAVELGMLALEKLARDGLSFEVDFFGAPLEFNKAPFAFRDHGVASPDKLANIFQKADIGVVFSATNYSLVPQEMMACGLPIVELEGESTRAIFPEEVVSLAKPTPVDIGDAIASLLNDPAKRRAQAKAALEWVRTFSWEQSADLIEKAMRERLSESFREKKRTKKNKTIKSAKGIKASVVIPTLNAGPVLDKVLKAVTSQCTNWPFETLVIDSGSTDETLDTVAKYQDVRLHQIEKKDFNHGATRNLGVSLTSGDYIAFLTHDAMPTNDRWLHNLVTALERFPDAAGVFGKHLAWPEAAAFTKRDLDEHFNNLSKFPLCVSQDTDRARYESGDESWRQVLHFYSDNNSCMRRSVWEKIPYRTIKFGEDQVWADDAIKAGYGKVYAPQAVVWHSHDFDADETYERCFTEAAFFRHSFGYSLIKDETALKEAIEASNRHDETWGLEHKVPAAEIELRKKLNVSRLRAFLDAQSANIETMF